MRLGQHGCRQVKSRPPVCRYSSVHCLAMCSRPFHVEAVREDSYIHFSPGILMMMMLMIFSIACLDETWSLSLGNIQIAVIRACTLKSKQTQLTHRSCRHLIPMDLVEFGDHPNGFFILNVTSGQRC